MGALFLRFGMRHPVGSHLSSTQVLQWKTSGQHKPPDGLSVGICSNHSSQLKSSNSNHPNGVQSPKLSFGQCFCQIGFGNCWDDHHRWWFRDDFEMISRTSLSTGGLLIVRTSPLHLNVFDSVWVIVSLCLPLERAHGACRSRRSVELWELPSPSHRLRNVLQIAIWATSPSFKKLLDLKILGVSARSSFTNLMAIDFNRVECFVLDKNRTTCSCCVFWFSFLAFWYSLLTLSAGYFIPKSN